MLNNKNVQAFFWIMLIVLMVINWQLGLPVYAFVLLLVSYLVVMFIGSYFIQLNFFIHSYNAGSKNKKTVALTFDDGPDAEYTPLILNILKEQKVSATFFVIGKNIKGNEELLKRIHAEGHTIGNHSYSHNFWFSMKSQKDMVNDLQACDTAIEEVIGKKPCLFRPPYGVTNPTIARVIEEGKYDSVGWSLRSYDTMAKSATALLTKITKRVKTGDVILLHDNGKYTATVLAEMIKAIKGKGFGIVRADELLGIKPYH